VFPRIRVLSSQPSELTPARGCIFHPSFAHANSHSSPSLSAVVLHPTPTSSRRGVIGCDPRSQSSSTSGEPQAASFLALSSLVNVLGSLQYTEYNSRL
jgi:hypothetical protein